MKPQAVKYLLMVQDMNRAVAFYRDTLGFTAGSISPHWSELRFGDAIVGLHGGGDGSRRETGLSIQYADVQAAHLAAIAAGASAITPPEQREGEPIVLATIADPEGNIIMLTGLADGGETAAPADIVVRKSVNWLDMIVDQPAVVSEFYQDIFGLKPHAVPEDEVHVSYSLKDDAGKEILGICDAAVFPDWVDGWLPYLDVADYEASVALVPERGGQVIKQLVMDYHWKGQRFCLARDPSGAPVMLCEAGPSVS